MDLITNRISLSLSLSDSVKRHWSWRKDCPWSFLPCAMSSVRKNHLKHVFTSPCFSSTPLPLTYAPLSAHRLLKEEQVLPKQKICKSENHQQKHLTKIFNLPIVSRYEWSNKFFYNTQCEWTFPLVSLSFPWPVGLSLRPYQVVNCHPKHLVLANSLPLCRCCY